MRFAFEESTSKTTLEMDSSTPSAHSQKVRTPSEMTVCKLGTQNTFGEFYVGRKSKCPVSFIADSPQVCYNFIHICKWAYPFSDYQFRSLFSGLLFWIASIILQTIFLSALSWWTLPAENQNFTLPSARRCWRPKEVRINWPLQCKRYHLLWFLIHQKPSLWLCLVIDQSLPESKATWLHGRDYFPLKSRTLICHHTGDMMHGEKCLNKSSSKQPLC